MLALKLQHVRSSSQARDQTHSPALGAPSLSYWTTKEVPKIHISCYANRLSALLTRLQPSRLLHAAPVPPAGLLCSSREPCSPCSRAFASAIFLCTNSFFQMLPSLALLIVQSSGSTSPLWKGLPQSLSPNPSSPYSVAVLFSSEHLSLSETSS